MILAWIIGIILIFQLTLNFLILSKGNYKKGTNLWFAAMNTSILSWIITISFANVDFNNYNISLLISKLSFGSIYIFTFFLFRFADSFSLVKLKLPKLINLYYNLSTPILLAILIITDIVIKGIIRTNDRYDIDRSGAMYTIFLLATLINLVIPMIVLFFKYRIAQQTERAKLRTILIGLVIVSIIVLLTNAIIPIFTGTTVSSSYGPLAIIIWLSIIFYTIRVHRFLDVRLVIGRVVYYILVGLVFLLAYYLVYYMDKTLFGSSEATMAVLTGPINAIIFSVIFIKLNDLIRTQVRSRIINPGYDPLEITDKLSREIAKLLSIKQITQLAIASLSQTIRADYVAFVIFTGSDNENGFLYEPNDNKKANMDAKVFHDLIILWNEINRMPIIIDEVDIESPSEFSVHKKKLAPILNYMRAKGLKVAIPLKETSDNIGILLLGKKEGDALYSIQDIEFIEGVASTVGLAITRSLYFLEVEDMNINLQKRVKIATRDLQTRNEQLTEAMTKLQETRRRERDMVDVMGHELRTPITIVRNALLYLQSRLEAGLDVPREKLAEYVDKAVESSRREINLVETLLSATKIDANRIQLNLTKIDMLDVINDSLEALRPTAEEKALEIKYDKPAEGFWSYADRTRTQEIMDNFLSNAIKYTQKGLVEIKIGKDEKEVHISVKDTGMGIHKDDMANLGKKFYRAKQYTANNGNVNVVRPGGTGLGLYVSFNLVKMMGGRVTIQSEPGQGSTFSMFLPLYTGQAEKHIDQTFD